MSNSSDKRVPSFIQFTVENSNTRAPKRRSTRLQKETQQSNKKRKKDTIQSNTSSRRRHGIARKENGTDHQQISPINDQDSVTIKYTCDTTANTSDHKILSISNNESGDEKPAKENDSNELNPMQQVSPSNEIGSNVVNHVLSLNQDINDAIAEEADSSPQQQMSPLSNHDVNSDDHAQQVLPEPHGHQEPLYDPFSMPAKRMATSTSSATAYSQHLEFNTITLSPDHGRKKIVPPSLLPITTAFTTTTTISVLDPPHKPTDTSTQPSTPSRPNNDDTTADEATFQEPSPIVVDTAINTSPPPVLSPSSANRHLLSSPSLWGSTDSSDSFTLSEPCEFYTPSTHLKDDTHCQQTDDNTDDKATTQNDTTFGWAVPMRIKGFFDRIKTALR